MNAAIVGCGNIAGFYDNPSTKQILTHAHAFLENKDTKLTACCDINELSLKNFTNIWGSDIRTYLDIDVMLKDEDIDIIVIATNTDVHYETLRKILLNTKIKNIICEKPFVSNIDQYNKIYELIEEKNPNLLINYIRCFDPSINRVKKLLKKEKFGKVLQFNGRFNKGLYHNGSHMLSLAEHLFGNISNLKAENLKILDDDLYGYFLVEAKRANGVLTNFSDTEFSIFEMEIICQKGIIKIYDSGFDIKAYMTKSSQTVSGTSQLELYKEYPNTLIYYAKNSLDFLLKKNSTKQQKKHLKLSYQLLKIKEELLAQGQS
ncbi:MAG: Gfo/Idh/MocA family oxidoreductase [Thiovulaceae bacterium]|nr:Gfo/Idh/MocA family oxidoreductase [Sulfurimonadaceae bacterium]